MSEVLSVITLSVHGLDSSIKRQRLAELILKLWFNYMLPTRDSAKTGRAERRTRLSTVIVRDFNTPSFPNG